jgi:hypothetical protein
LRIVSTLFAVLRRRLTPSAELLALRYLGREAFALLRTRAGGIRQLGVPLLDPPPRQLGKGDAAEIGKNMRIDGPLKAFFSLPTAAPVVGKVITQGVRDSIGTAFDLVGVLLCQVREPASGGILGLRKRTYVSAIRIGPVISRTKGSIPAPVFWGIVTLILYQWS